MLAFPSRRRVAVISRSSKRSLLGTTYSDMDASDSLKLRVVEIDRADITRITAEQKLAVTRFAVNVDVWAHHIVIVVDLINHGSIRLDRPLDKRHEIETQLFFVNDLAWQADARASVVAEKALLVPSSGLIPSAV